MKFPNIVLPSGPMPYADVTAALEASAVAPCGARRATRGAFALSSPLIANSEEHE